MTLATNLIARHFGNVEGELAIGGVPATRIARELGTPLFVYDSGVIDKTWTSLRNALPDAVEIFYSIKANPNRAILKLFLDRGAGLEIASGGELYQALAAGCSPERIVFAGPGKSETEIREFLSAGGGEIHVESVLEAERLVRIGGELGVDAKAAVRVNPSSEARGGAMRMGGKPAPFGIDEEVLEKVVAVLDRAERVVVTGVHIFAGTQILDNAILEAQYRKCIDIARSLKRDIRTVDFGGGLGIPYFEGDRELDVERFGEMVHGLLRREAKGDAFRDTRFIVEPGRYLVGEAGIYLTKVTDVKISRGKRFVIVDGGMNHHLAASGNLGQVIKRNFPIAIANGREGGLSSPADIVGPLCTPLDVLARNVEFPEVEVGDILCVLQSGAYARTASPLGFLSHPSPAEALVGGGKFRTIRKRGRYEDFVHNLQ